MNGRKGDVTSDGSFRAKQQKPRPVTSNHHSPNLKFRQPRKQIWNKFRTNPDDKKFQPKFRDLGIATTLEFKETQFLLHTNRSWCKRTPNPWESDDCRSESESAENSRFPLSLSSYLLLPIVFLFLPLLYHCCDSVLSSISKLTIIHSQPGHHDHQTQHLQQ